VDPYQPGRNSISHLERPQHEQSSHGSRESAGRAPSA